MAKGAVTFCQVGNRSFEGSSVSVARLPGARTEVLTSGASSVATTGTSGDVIPGGYSGVNRDGGFASVMAVGGNVWVTSGTAPVAAPASGDGFPLLDGQTRDFAVARGDKIAVINWVP